MSDVSEADVKKIMMEIMRKSSDSDTEESRATKYSGFSALKQKVSSFLEPAPKFRPGDVVRWKKGLKNKRYPKEGQLCIVMEEMKEPIIQDNRDAGSPYYREPLDLVLALLEDDSDLVIFHYDKRRFERVEEVTLEWKKEIFTETVSER